MKQLKCLTLFAVLSSTTLLCAQALSGTIVSVGSDTLEKMMHKWSKEFSSTHPSVKFDITAAGSSTAPPALISGKSHLGPMSRKMKGSEVSAFEQNFGYKPTAIRVALDALAVFVHKDNPIESLSLQQVDAVFSSTVKCGGKSASKWSDLGQTGALASLTIDVYGRNKKSGTHSYFKKRALCKGQYIPSITELPSSEAIVAKIGGSINAIGYSGIGYQTSAVKALALSKKDGGTVFSATPGNAETGDYPLSRYLYIYVNKKPGEKLPSDVREFLTFILSNKGQSIVKKLGYISVSKKVIDRDTQKLGI